MALPLFGPPEISLLPCSKLEPYYRDWVIEHYEISYLNKIFVLQSSQKFLCSIPDGLWHPFDMSRSFVQASKSPCLQSKHSKALSRRPLQCNPTKLSFPKIRQNTKCRLMNVTTEQVKCKLLNKSAVRKRRITNSTWNFVEKKMNGWQNILLKRPQIPKLHQSMLYRIDFHLL